MGLLPSTRTTPTPPFYITGVDFAGPLITRRGHTRKPVMVKAYACIFVCFTTKALHIELCLDPTTNEFMTRRGTPSQIHSDNGTNFVGANNEFQRIRQLLHASKGSISHFESTNNLKWNFNLPRTPHMGGLWEAAVKSMKRLLRKILQFHLLRVDELSSILIELEAVLNSRPLILLETTNPDDLVLTPGHFLIGRRIVTPPTAPSTLHTTCRLRRWQLTQRLTQDFWHLWKTAYLQALQQRHTWNEHTKQFQEGDIVFLREDTLSYRQWPLVRITKLLPVDVGITKVVELRCKGKTLRRATVHLIPFTEDYTTQITNSPLPSLAPPSLFRFVSLRLRTKQVAKHRSSHLEHKLNHLYLIVMYKPFPLCVVNCISNG